MIYSTDALCDVTGNVERTCFEYGGGRAAVGEPLHVLKTLYVKGRGRLVSAGGTVFSRDAHCAYLHHLVLVSSHDDEDSSTASTFHYYLVTTIARPSLCFCVIVIVIGKFKSFVLVESVFRALVSSSLTRHFSSGVRLPNDKNRHWPIALPLYSRTNIFGSICVGKGDRVRGRCKSAVQEVGLAVGGAIRGTEKLQR